MNLEIFAPYREIVDDWPAFAEALARPLPTCLWTNTLRTAPDVVAGWLEREGLEAEPLAWYPGAFRVDAGAKPGRSVAYAAGLYHVQEEVSLLPALLLDPQPGERVLDLCAAPGGKTCQMAVYMGDRGTLVANDRNRFRVGVMLRHLERLGVTCSVALQEDGANLGGARLGLFDRVLADVPCSCEGTVRKNPEIWQRRAELAPDALEGAQVALLRKAVQLCRPGGRVVYSTCTFNPKECEGVVDKVLDETGPGVLEMLPARVEGLRSAPGLETWRGKRFSAEMGSALRIWPHHNDTGGFFVAVLQKKRGVA